MESFKYNLEHIERYYYGQFTPSELKEYEYELSTNPEWKAEHDIQLELIEAIQHVDDKTLKETITLITNQNKSHSKTIVMNTKKSNSGLIMKVAAAFIILAAATFWFTNGNSQVAPGELLAQHYNPESSQVNDAINKLGMAGFGKSNPADTSGISNITEEELLAKQAAEQRRKDTLVLALKQFKSSEWKTSRKTLFEYLEKFEEPSEDLTTARYHYAKACMNMSDYASAVNEYDKLLSGSVPQKMQWEADFERALSYLQIDAPKAKQYFETISKDMGHKYRDIADGMLTNL